MSTSLFRIISNIRTTCRTGGREQSWNSQFIFSFSDANICQYSFSAATRNKFSFKRHCRSVGSAWNALVSARVMSTDPLTLQAQSDSLAEETHTLTCYVCFRLFKTQWVSDQLWLDTYFVFSCLILISDKNSCSTVAIANASVTGSVTKW